MTNDTYIVPGLVTNYTNITDLMSAGEQVLAQQLHDIQIVLVLLLALTIIQTVINRRSR